MSSLGHTCIDLGIPVTGGVEEKEEVKNLLKWGKFFLYVMIDRKILIYLKKKKETATFDSEQKIHSFWFLNGTIYHIKANGAVWSNPLIFSTH